MPVLKLRVYNAASDAGDVCADCARWDLAELADSDDTTVQIPNPACRCDGGCACYWTWVGRIVGDGSDAERRTTKRLC